MSEIDSITSLDEMRDMDEADGQAWVDPAGDTEGEEHTYLFNVQTSFKIKARSEKEAEELLLETTGEDDRIRVIDQEMMYVGDTASDLQAAQAAGYIAAWASWGYGNPDDCLAQKPDLILASPTQLILEVQ